MPALRVPRWITLLLWALVAGYAAYVAWTMGAGYRSAARGEMPLYTDYTTRYAASLLLQVTPAEYLYVPEVMVRAGRQAARTIYGNITQEQASGVGFATWRYPPSYMLFVAPLALMPYWISWFSWLALTAIPYLSAMRRILPGALAWPLALAAPPVFFNVMYGQTGFLVGGLIALGLTLLQSRPWLAGILIGLASVKPHFGVLIPLALIAGGYWRTLFSTGATLMALLAVSVLVYGDEPWFAFIGISLSYLDIFSVGAINYVPMTSVLSTFRLAGFPIGTAWQAQGLAAVAMALVVGWVWWGGRRRPESLGLRCAILCLATPLALPLVFLYDLVLIVPAAAWLLDDMLRRGRSRWEIPLLALLMLALLAVKPLASAGLQIGALLIAGLLCLSLRRFLQPGEHVATPALPQRQC